MNSLSWLIYLAYATDKMGDFFMFLTIMSGICIAISMVVKLFTLDKTDSSYHRLSQEDLASRAEAGKSAIKYAKISSFMMIFFGITTNILPNRQTVLLIAASEIGERVVQSPQALGVIDPSVDLLKTWIAQQTLTIKKSMESAQKN